MSVLEVHCLPVLWFLDKTYCIIKLLSLLNHPDNCIGFRFYKLKKKKKKVIKQIANCLTQYACWCYSDILLLCKYVHFGLPLNGKKHCKNV